ncbi:MULTISPECIES: polysaccharide deacetylase family protein [Bradyrhizobium]|uniref:polysaccharide deacetylase family protein n=1 Tax=Bradyrhizobium TaxID=374 RepID=UPI001EDC28F1|nr:polysaccharide deacetylase family protein [Bradyrhizobium zhengyangense]MCG2645416.1 polysaccharide deacetylase family protein [Bradyrhizobium zhengyangense]
MRRYVKILISLTYFAGRAILRFILGQSSAQRLTVLYYHGISAEDRSAFARQMEALHRGAQVVPASHRGPLPEGKKCVAITFDDAFVSVAQNALPELARYAFHSTIFVPVGWLGRAPGWVMNEIEGATGAGGSSERLEVVMSREQLQALSASLVSLGSHTISHPSMPSLSPKQLREELEDSKARLMQLNKGPILDFSFPYGEYDVGMLADCRAAGYEAVYSISSQEIDTTAPDLLRGRTKVDPSDGPLEFFLKFNGAYHWTRFTTPLKRFLGSMKVGAARDQATSR